MREIQSYIARAVVLFSVNLVRAVLGFRVYSNHELLFVIGIDKFRRIRTPYDNLVLVVGYKRCGMGRTVSAERNLSVVFDLSVLLVLMLAVEGYARNFGVAYSQLELVIRFVNLPTEVGVVDSKSELMRALLGSRNHQSSVLYRVRPLALLQIGRKHFGLDYFGRILDGDSHIELVAVVNAVHGVGAREFKLVSAAFGAQYVGNFQGLGGNLEHEV